MLSYITEIDLKRKEVRVVLGKDSETFVFDEDKFPLLEAMKVSAEFMHNKLVEFLSKLVQKVEDCDLIYRISDAARELHNRSQCDVQTCPWCNSNKYEHLAIWEYVK